MLDAEDKIGAFNYLKTYKEYLIVYKKCLIFSRDNFDAIMNGKEPETKEYDVLYAIYQSEGNKLNDANLQKEKALKEYLEKHSEFIDHMKQAQKRLEKAGN
ncbi:MAG: hypothetical protein SRB2_02835 [Desulfobacteraceae bacterium Eth-SRB2]|nr:MAG: hypothetical protein SRB2_02835 [Desulfobacteraceae bacterium Eth-SRB2]